MPEYKNMVSLRIYPEDQRKTLANNYVCSVLAPYIRYICWSRKTYLLKTRQPLRNTRQYFESGMDKKELDLLYKIANACIEDPAEYRLSELYDAAVYFYPPYGNLKSTWKKERI